ncbi:MAG: class I poly(R)-hydroxyalkanoic acid synthase, partial [Alphaproteobacteria bacterium]|nr:class I poly(R)-hydroxyalkanoic acid synthase [Alphaproteobacteria bacterium]
RFKDAAWEQGIFFDTLKQSYLLTAQWILDQTNKAKEELDPHTAHKVAFFTRQFVDALSPSNFFATNPEAIKKFLETNGGSLARGVDNLLEDIEDGKGNFVLKMTDDEAFAVGKNLATTPGKVIHRNDLIELIQYSPTTETVFQKPLLFIPAWINKYYIADLTPENSLIRWLVDQGYTVFIISWANPDSRHREKTFDDYLLEGPLEALKVIEDATGEKEITAIGYCLGGTLLGTTQAHLATKGKSPIAAATYLTTMMDFSQPGDLGVFIDEEQISELEKRMEERGYLEGKEMAGTFNMLRANDLIWSFVVNNYLLGKEPFPFDVLYWNSDSTRMPAKMHSFYLRSMYLHNRLIVPGGLTIAGTPIDLRNITTPSYFLSTREDHIAPWMSTYAATQLMKGSSRFVLAASGHIVGVINPPTKAKYCHWVSEKLPPSPKQWLESATQVEGSWWPDWHRWNADFSGGKVPARIPGNGKMKAIEDAPGSYVKARS